MYSKELYRTDRALPSSILLAGICDPLTAKIDPSRFRGMPIECEYRTIGNAAFFIHHSARTSAPIPITTCHVTHEDDGRTSLNQLDYP
jgi:hypothetical protein